MSGLEGASFVDKVDNMTIKTESASELAITGETDRVYTPVGKDTLIAIHEGGSKTFSISRDNLEQTVVWNPWVEKAAGMADFIPDDGYKNMICVEPGSVSSWTKLENGDQFEGAQTITSL